MANLLEGCDDVGLGDNWDTGETRYRTTSRISTFLTGGSYTLASDCNIPGNLCRHGREEPRGHAGEVHRVNVQDVFREATASVFVLERCNAIPPAQTNEIFHILGDSKARGLPRLEECTTVLDCQLQRSP